MKKYINIILSATALACCSAAIGSCSLVSEDFGSVNDTIFPQSEKDAELLVIGSAYEVFRLGQWAGYFSMTQANGCDDITISKAYHWFPWNWGNYRLDMDKLVEPWNSYYTKLSRLEQTEVTISELPSSDQKTRARQIAEIRLAKGWLALQLWNFYGPIPLVPVEVLNDPNNEQDYPRATEEEMEDYIVGNITAAIPDLDVIYNYGDANYGRFTQALGHMLLLKFYMQKRYWDRAEAEARELMDPKYGFEIMPSYKELFTFAGEGNKETIWACVAKRGVCDGTGVFVANSLPGDYATGTATQAWNGNALTWPFFHSFEEGDLRIADEQLVISDYISNQYRDANGEFIHHSYEHDYVNGVESGENTLFWGPAAVKYEIDPNTTGYDSDLDFIVYRYADVLTLLAEAIYKQDGVTQEAVDLINRIRTRAGLQPYQIGDEEVSDTNFMDTLLEERAHELWWENDFRRLDLIRNDLWNEKMREKCEFYHQVQYIGNDNFERYPIPTSAIISSHGAIEQNPGY